MSRNTSPRDLISVKQGEQDWFRAKESEGQLFEEG